MAISLSGNVFRSPITRDNIVIDNMTPEPTSCITDRLEKKSIGTKHVMITGTIKEAIFKCLDSKLEVCNESIAY